MKLINKFMLLMAVVLFAACSTDVDTPQINSSDKFVTPIIGQCTDVIINADNNKDEMVVFSWTAADFGLPIEIQYTIYITNGISQAKVSTSKTTSLSISKGDFNNIVLKGLGIGPNETVSLQAFVTAEIAGSIDGDTNAYTPISSALSNNFSVTTYKAQLKNLYVVGFFNSWAVDKAVEIWEASAGTNIYEGMYNFIEDETNTPGYSGWKVLDDRSWDKGNWGFDAFASTSKDITSSSDGNLVLPAGIWQISVDLNNKANKIVNAKKVGTTLGLIGDFNGWGADAFFTYSATENVWKTEPVQLTGGTGIKIRVDSAWSMDWGTTGTMSSTIDNGFELGQGLGNITVPTDGTYIAVLHSDRTPYVLELVAQ